MPDVVYCLSERIADYLYYSSVRLVDYQKHLANNFRLEIVNQVKCFAKKKRVEIEHAPVSIHKEAFVAKRVEGRRGQSGVVCIVSGMDSCRRYNARLKAAQTSTFSGRRHYNENHRALLHWELLNPAGHLLEIT